MSAPIPQNCTWVDGVSPADAPTPADRLTTARARLADLLEKYPEMAAYTRPASEGSVRDVVAKLDEIAGLLRAALSASADEANAIKSLLARHIVTGAF